MSVNTSQNLQELAASFANSILSQINNVAAEVAGTEIMYFRSKPVESETDFIFHDYTLYNVEDCPLNMKAIYKNTSYDESSYIFSTLGMDYQTPLELELDMVSWRTATGADGTIPQSGDIIYIPLTDKLWEVSSMNPTKNAGQVTSYRINCKKYQPSKHRYTGENLTASIDNKTVTTEEQYGEKIKGSIQDLVDDPQNTVFVSSTMDNYKQNPVTRIEDSIKKKVNCIIDLPDNLKIDGHIVAHSCYNGAVIPNHRMVEYKKPDSYSEKDVRCLAEWICLKESFKQYDVEINGVSDAGKFTYLNIHTDHPFKENSDIFIERGGIKLFGTYVENKVKVYSSLLKKLPSNWDKLSNYKIQESETVNLLSAKGDYNISIDIKGGRFLVISSGDFTNYTDLGCTLEPEHWYGIIINLSNNTSVSLFDSKDKLHLIKESNMLVSWKGNRIDNYYINSSNSYITNIRYYDIANKELETQLHELVSYNIQNNSHAIINDSADVYLNMPYYCEEG